ncbi:IclR family transcriptional regulator [Caballeronia hypogeia]|uniref:IclR family transcriptional regulator n=1 Tax=Caballeronia hypogeia TaxID=1777140 RepID=A0A158AEQ9_9BURK|nr:IclR family transcriptional regulator C-terminal domain-containing protein [Caballeronia hypogeia]SAK56313.1 IclR family transcriptional regulator [Caballeronia hypogeia]
MSTGEGTASLDKALTVLDLIGSASSGISNAALLEQAGLPKTTLYRILATLVERRLIRRDAVNRVYRLGFRYIELVRNAYLMPDLVGAASSELRALRDLTGETAYLAILDGRSVLSLDRCDGAHSYRSSASLGQSKPLHCTGQGKAIMSRLPREERDALLKTITLDPLTPRTITDRRGLQIEIGITAARGYAIDDEEIVLGVRCVAAPIVDPLGRVRGALSVAGPAYRLTMARLELLGPELADAARRVGAQLTATQVARDSDEVAPVSDGWAFHGAFPNWSQETGCLYWADTLAPAIHCFDGEKDRIVATLDAPVTAMQDSAEGLIVAQGDRHGRYTPREGWHALRAGTAWDDVAIAPLCMDHNRDVWAAQMREQQTLVGTITEQGRFETRWTFHEPITAMTWDASGEVAFAIAPDSGTIFTMTAQSSSVRRFASMPKGAGRLCGLAFDDEGGLWTALQEGWSVVRFSAEGNLDRIVSLPVAAPTGIAFARLKNEPALYITTDRHLQPIESLGTAPWSGYLLKVKTSVAGSAADTERAVSAGA